MKRNTLFATAVIATALAVSPVVYASSLTIDTPVHGMFGKKSGKTVQFSIRNDSSLPLNILVGDKPMTISAGQSVSLDTPVGTRIVANDTTETHHAGVLFFEVASYNSGKTMSLK